MKILGIIPARGKSKGLSKKNIRVLTGKPLIQYTIDSAKKSKINKIIVSTDNKKIAEISKSLGAEVPFLRPKSISGDGASSESVIKHVLKFLKKQSYIPDIVVLLQPTSPLKTTKIINDSISLLKKSKSSSVISVSKVKTHPYSSFWISGKYLTPFKKNFEKYYSRQKTPELYHPNGMIYTFWNGTLEKYDSIYGPKIKPMFTPLEISYDIDTLLDLFMCEMTKLNFKKYKKSQNDL